MRNRDAQRGQVVVETLGLIPIVAIAAAISLDCGIVVADRLAITRVATTVATADTRATDITSVARKAAPERLTKSVKARTVKGRVDVSARPRTLLLGRFTHLTVRSRVELPDSPEVAAR